MFLFLELRHAHNRHHETGPTGEMLCPLAPPGFRVVLFPREACKFPFIEDGAHEVGTE